MQKAFSHAPDSGPDEIVFIYFDFGPDWYKIKNRLKIVEMTLMMVVKQTKTTKLKLGSTPYLC